MNFKVIVSVYNICGYLIAELEEKNLQEAKIGRTEDCERENFTRCDILT